MAPHAPPPDASGNNDGVPFLVKTGDYLRLSESDSVRVLLSGDRLHEFRTGDTVTRRTGDGAGTSFWSIVLLGDSAVTLNNLDRRHGQRAVSSMNWRAFASNYVPAVPPAAASAEVPEAPAPAAPAASPLAQSEAPPAPSPGEAPALSQNGPQNAPSEPAPGVSPPEPPGVAYAPAPGWGGPPGPGGLPPRHILITEDALHGIVAGAVTASTSGAIEAVIQRLLLTTPDGSVATLADRLAKTATNLTHQLARHTDAIWSLRGSMAELCRVLGGQGLPEGAPTPGDVIKAIHATAAPEPAAPAAPGPGGLTPPHLATTARRGEEVADPPPFRFSGDGGGDNAARAPSEADATG